jgi:hydrogenase expression/formation protein HypC
MCMAIPMQVLEVSADGLRARCQGRAGEAEVDTLLSGPLQAGQWVLTFLGSAREVVTAEDARRIDDALDALEGLLDGRPVDLDAAFADLVDRLPQLPEHLRGPR